MKYNEQYDADYDKNSGNWLDEKCDDIECEFCKDRPRVAPIWIKTIYELPLEEDADEMGLVWAFWNNEVVLSHYNSVRCSDMWNIAITMWKPKPKVKRPEPPGWKLTAEIQGALQEDE